MVRYPACNCSCCSCRCVLWSCAAPCSSSCFLPSLSPSPSPSYYVPDPSKGAAPGVVKDSSDPAIEGKLELLKVGCDAVDVWVERGADTGAWA